jgi:pimeloyl-ACP methyl ester carboxylesterase
MDHTTIGFRDLARYTLSAVLDSLGIDRVPIVAHSMGGHWSQWFAMDRPDRVTALALLGVPGNVLTTQPPPALRLASVRGLNRLAVRATIPRKTEDALNGLGFLGHSAETLKRLPAAMGECYFTFDRLPNYQMSTRTLMQVTNRLRGSNPRIRITEAELRHGARARRAPVGRARPFRRRRDRETHRRARAARPVPGAPRRWPPAMARRPRDSRPPGYGPPPQHRAPE